MFPTVYILATDVMLMARLWAEQIWSKQRQTHSSDFLIIDSPRLTMTSRTTQYS